MEITPPTPLDDRLWLLEHYLAGDLPDKLHQQVTTRRQNDSVFDQEVMALWLIHRHLADEQAVADLNLSTAALLVELQRQQTPEKPARKAYNTQKITPFLADIIFSRKHALQVRLMLAAAVYILLVGCFWWLSLPPVATRSTFTLSDEGSDGKSMGGAPIPVVQYSHAPGLLGVWRTAEQYRWPDDTLYLYGNPAGTAPAAGWRLERIPNTSQYRLIAGKRTYLITPQQTTLLPLVADEHP